MGIVGIPNQIAGNLDGPAGTVDNPPGTVRIVENVAANISKGWSKRSPEAQGNFPIGPPGRDAYECLLKEVVVQGVNLGVVVEDEETQEGPTTALVAHGIGEEGGTGLLVRLEGRWENPLIPQDRVLVHIGGDSQVAPSGDRWTEAREGTNVTRFGFGARPPEIKPEAGLDDRTAQAVKLVKD